jgi:hypothetical protein
VAFVASLLLIRPSLPAGQNQWRAVLGIPAVMIVNVVAAFFISFVLLAFYMFPHH